MISDLKVGFLVIYIEIRRQTDLHISNNMNIMHLYWKCDYCYFQMDCDMELGSFIEVAERGHSFIIITSFFDYHQIIRPTSTISKINTASTFIITDFINDCKAIICYTGLEDYDKFQFVLNSLGPVSYSLNYIYSLY